MTAFLPSSLSRRDTSRMSAYTDNLDFYNGSQWPGSGRERRLVFNYARVAVDKVTSYLMAGFAFACDPLQDGPQAKAKARAAEITLHQVFNDNNLPETDFETEIDTAVLGDGCYKVLWDNQARKVRVTAPDVAGIFAWHTGDDLAQVYQVASRYKLSQDEIASLYGRTIQKDAAFVTERWTRNCFEIWLDDDLMSAAPNPYGFIPFIIFPNVRQPKAPWGLSDIPAIMESQRELNRAISQLSRILELSGNPIAVLENVESSSGIQVQPGAVWHLPEASKAYLLDLLKGGGARLHIEYIDVIYRCLHDLSEAPRAAYGGIQQELSGVALEVELNSLLQKVQRKRNTRSGAYRRRNEMVLALLEKFAGRDFGPLRHRIVWGSVVPQDKARQAQNEQLLVTSGVHSRKRAMDELGVEDPEAEFSSWMEERRAILQMNQEYRARSTRGGPRERAETAGAPDEDA